MSEADAMSGIQRTSPRRVSRLLPDEFIGDILFESCETRNGNVSSLLVVLRFVLERRRERENDTWILTQRDITSLRRNKNYLLFS